MSIRCLRATLGAALLALGACATATDPAGPVTPELATAMTRYYAGRAFEENAFCTVPYIDRITASRVVEDSPQKLVVEVRYFFRSEIGASPGDVTMFNRCEGFASRTFTFDRSAGGLTLAGMTGDQRR
ncbi:MAG: hypothetical protein U1E14_04990 [Geminicoccaceae bacterium]